MRLPHSWQFCLDILKKLVYSFQEDNGYGGPPERNGRLEYILILEIIYDLSYTEQVWGFPALREPEVSSLGCDNNKSLRLLNSYQQGDCCWKRVAVSTRNIISPHDSDLTDSTITSGALNLSTALKNGLSL